MNNIKDNLYKIHSNIEELATKYNRKPQDIKLLCVSKTKPQEMIIAAYKEGERNFGESYVNEAVDKIQQLKAQGFTDIKWHFIGPIQKNKTKLIAANFDIVESVDREIILKRLSEQRPASYKPLEILIEVNLSGESQKSGCAFDKIENLVEACKKLPNLCLKGFMGIASETADVQKISEEFKALHKIYSEYQAKDPNIEVLSMGMTHDLEQALANGSTELRIGTAIFGERSYSKAAVANKHIAFIGGGNMATCIFDGIAKSYSTAKITVSGPHLEKLNHFKEAKAAITTDNIEAAANADVIFLGVKPQILTSVLTQLRNAKIDFSNKLVISMAAGFKLSSIEKYLNSEKIIRIMPNTPAKIGLGVIAVCYGNNVDDQERQLCRELLANLGKCFEGDEQNLNVIGAICGCGPAFVYRFMEALCAEGCRYGLDADSVRKMVELTLLGSANMSKNNPEISLQSLREAVTSKGGTTYAGLQMMTQGKFEEMMTATIKASLDRTYEFEKLY